jgi:hypothetical protein
MMGYLNGTRLVLRILTPQVVLPSGNDIWLKIQK